jgi:hypothetical protein
MLAAHITASRCSCGAGRQSFTINDSTYSAADEQDLFSWATHRPTRHDLEVIYSHATIPEIKRQLLSKGTCRKVEK